MARIWDFTGYMAGHQANAQAARNKGYHTGKSAKGWQFKRRDPEAGSFARLAEECRISMRLTAANAIEDYLRAVYPERYEEFT